MKVLFVATCFMYGLNVSKAKLSISNLNTTFIEQICLVKDHFFVEFDLNKGCVESNLQMLLVHCLY